MVGVGGRVIGGRVGVLEGGVIDVDEYSLLYGKCREVVLAEHFPFHKGPHQKFQQFSKSC